MSVEFLIPTLPKLDTRNADISWVTYHPISLEAPSLLTPEEEAPIISFWTTTVLGLDIALRDEKNETTNSFLIRFGSEMKAYYNRKRQELSSSVTSYLMDHPEALYLSMASGSLPDMMDIWIRADKQEIHTRMHSIIVGGSDGASIKKTILKSKLPDMGTAIKPTVIGDDVGDTMAAVAKALEEIESQRSGKPVDSTLSETLAGSYGKPFGYYRGAYLELVHRLHEQNILLAMNVYKNTPFVSELSYASQQFLIKSDQDEWARQQKLFLDFALEKPADQWLMGMDLDSGVKGVDIIRFLNPSFSTNPKTKPYINHLALSMLRIGASVDTLIALQKRGDRYAYDELISWIGQNINQRLERLFNS